MIEQPIEDLLKSGQYDLPQEQKERVLLPLLRDLCRSMGERCPAYGRFLKRLGSPIETWRTLADIPPLP